MENELKTNAKSLSPEEQYQICKSIVRLSKSIVRLSKQGKTNPEIADILDVSERHVRNVKQNYANHGIAGIKPKKRGRREGEKRTLRPRTRARGSANYHRQKPRPIATSGLYVDARQYPRPHSPNAPTSRTKSRLTLG
ncbi:MAG: helix-turn-helix domain-containing protein [Clostridiales bacterium]|jgi:hypothetical protein|nr:helix-turn-helix domain-containing protein [Clostridiales bacterium]